MKEKQKQKNNQTILEGQGEISNERLEELRKDPTKRVKEVAENTYKVLDRLHG